jgi:hypothetical protein
LLVVFVLSGVFTLPKQTGSSGFVIRSGWRTENRLLFRLKAWEQGLMRLVKADSEMVGAPPTTGI